MTKNVTNHKKCDQKLLFCDYFESGNRESALLGGAGFGVGGGGGGVDFGGAFADDANTHSLTLSGGGGGDCPGTETES